MDGMAKPLEMNYCPRCGHALEDRFLYGRDRRACPACGFIFFRDPKVAAGVLVERDGKVLLVKRSVDPNKGDWALPAGFVEIDEGPVQGALRELAEETGFIGKITSLLGVFHNRSDPRGPIVIILYCAQIVGGDLHPADDAEEVRFFARDELPKNIAFASTRRALLRWRCQR
jgi:ADP-ribose pyrophosphatase YjhB (NUDIX family)